MVYKWAHTNCTLAPFRLISEDLISGSIDIYASYCVQQALCVHGRAHRELFGMIRVSMSRRHVRTACANSHNKSGGKILFY